MRVPKMVKNGFNSVLQTSAGSRRLVAQGIQEQMRSPKLSPNHKRRIKTILDQFSNTHARARARVCVVDIPYMKGGDFAREGAIVNLSNKSKKALVEISLRNQNSAMILKRTRKSAHFNLIPL